MWKKKGQNKLSFVPLKIYNPYRFFNVSKRVKKWRSPVFVYFVLYYTLNRGGKIHGKKRRHFWDQITTLPHKQLHCKVVIHSPLQTCTQTHSPVKHRAEQNSIKATFIKDTPNEAQFTKHETFRYHNYTKFVKIRSRYKWYISEISRWHPIKEEHLKTLQ